MLAENRARVALEKEKIRKDYEKMSSQLSNILNNTDLANSFVQVSDFFYSLTFQLSYSIDSDCFLVLITEQRITVRIKTQANFRRASKIDEQRIS